MAQFHVYRISNDRIVLDLQSDLSSTLYIMRGSKARIAVV